MDTLLNTTFELPNGDTAYNNEDGKSFSLNPIRTVSNTVLSPNFWTMRGPSNRITGNKKSDNHFQNYLKGKNK